MTSHSIASGRARYQDVSVRRFPATGAGVVLGLLLVLCDAMGTAAQDPGQIKADVRVGTTSPTGELADFLAGGPSLWIGGRYMLNRRFAILVEGGRSYLPGKEPSGRPDPSHRYEIDTRLQHVLLGTEVALAPFDREAVGASIRVATGRVSYRVERRPDGTACGPPSRASFLEEAWTGGVGMRLSYELRTAARLSVSADLIGAFQDLDDMFVEPRAWPCLDVGKHFVKGFGLPLTFPVTVGLSVGL